MNGNNNTECNRTVNMNVKTAHIKVNMHTAERAKIAKVT